MLKAISVGVFILTLVAVVLVGFTMFDQSKSTNGEIDLREYYLESYDVKIEINTDEHCAVISQNPITVKSGSSATFEVLFEENFKFSENGENNGVSYSKGIITVSDCIRNSTVNITSEQIAEYYSFNVENTQSELGSISASTVSGTFIEGKEITVNAIPAPSQTFIGWSFEKPIADGGNIISYTPEYTFKLSSDTKLYPNFLTEGYTIIRYHLNGGVLGSDGVTDTVLTQFNAAGRLCPNLIPNDNTFVREGHTLLEYSENPDGTGEVYTPGGIAKVPSTGILEVYAQWSEWTPAEHFDYALDRTTGEMVITKYSRNDSTVSIPAEIDGYPVTKIATGAFKRKTFDTLIVPSSIVKMEASAFESCVNFNTLYITDSFTSIYEDAFNNCKKFSNLRLSAALPPHNVNHAENLAPRIDVMLTRESTDKPMMLFVGGSSCLYGIKAYKVEEAFGGKYQVLNCGTNAGGTGVLYMEAFAHYLTEGDVIVNVPEYGANQMGGNEIVWRTIRATESCYDIYRYVDFSKYKNFFKAMTEYNTDPEARASKGPSSYSVKPSSLSERYCDLASTNKSANKKYSTTRVNSSSLSDAAIIQINRLITHLEGSGITYYFSCAPICYTNASGTLSTEKDLNAFYQRAVENLNCKVISHPSNYTFDTYAYHNSNYHLDTEHALIRTANVITDLKAALKE